MEDHGRIVCVDSGKAEGKDLGAVFGAIVWMVVYA